MATVQRIRNYPTGSFGTRRIPQRTLSNATSKTIDTVPANTPTLFVNPDGSRIKFYIDRTLPNPHDIAEKINHYGGEIVSSSSVADLSIVNKTMETPSLQQLSHIKKNAPIGPSRFISVQHIDKLISENTSLDTINNGQMNNENKKITESAQNALNVSKRNAFSKNLNRYSIGMPVRRNSNTYGSNVSRKSVNGSFSHQQLSEGINRVSVQSAFHEISRGEMLAHKLPSSLSEYSSSLPQAQYDDVLLEPDDRLIDGMLSSQAQDLETIQSGQIGTQGSEIDLSLPMNGDFDDSNLSDSDIQIEWALSAAAKDIGMPSSLSQRSNKPTKPTLKKDLLKSRFTLQDLSEDFESPMHTPPPVMRESEMLISMSQQLQTAGPQASRNKTASQALSQPGNMHPNNRNSTNSFGHVRDLAQRFDTSPREDQVSNLKVGLKKAPKKSGTTNSKSVDKENILQRKQAPEEDTHDIPGDEVLAEGNDKVVDKDFVENSVNGNSTNDLEATSSVKQGLDHAVNSRSEEPVDQATHSDKGKDGRDSAKSPRTPPRNNGINPVLVPTSVYTGKRKRRSSSNFYYYNKTSPITSEIEDDNQLILNANDDDNNEESQSIKKSRASKNTTKESSARPIKNAQGKRKAKNTGLMINRRGSPIGSFNKRMRLSPESPIEEHHETFTQESPKDSSKKHVENSKAQLEDSNENGEEASNSNHNNVDDNDDFSMALQEEQELGQDPIELTPKPAYADAPTVATPTTKGQEQDYNQVSGPDSTSAPMQDSDAHDVHPKQVSNADESAAHKLPLSSTTFSQVSIVIPVNGKYNKLTPQKKTPAKRRTSTKVTPKKTPKPVSTPTMVTRSAAKAALKSKKKTKTPRYKASAARKNNVPTKAASTSKVTRKKPLKSPKTNTDKGSPKGKGVDDSYDGGDFQGLVSKMFQTSIEKLNITHGDRESFKDAVDATAAYYRCSIESVYKILYASSGDWKIAAQVLTQFSQDSPNADKMKEIESLLWKKDQDTIIFKHLQGNSYLGDNKSSDELERLVELRGKEQVQARKEFLKAYLGIN
ncbi:hypothetical protein H4219_000966 [Mycoemilia scoparia]|uniref:TRF2-interacting telomeric protein/Rap1 C-terminal domain-containing protein n=1 Tax=Mycoemilia scoparia TaxID=417184 RepID=A0A9W8DWM0_9FUNG|nr:hypothetical protein H4219_000966 [Mycoemilia scoparia]